VSARKKDKWKGITHKVLWPSVEAIRTRFGIVAWSAASVYEQKCYKELTAENRSRTEPEIFLHHFAGGFSEFLTMLVGDTFNRILDIASKNRVKGGPVDWTRSQLVFVLEDKLRLSSKASRIRDWVACACDGCYLTKEPAHEAEAILALKMPLHRGYVPSLRNPINNFWLAPSWLCASLYDRETAWARVSEERTQRILAQKSDLVASFLEGELNRLTEQEHRRRAVTPIESKSAVETATSIEMHEKPFQLPSRKGNDRWLEECHLDGAIPDRQYRALDLSINYSLKVTDVGRAMEISPQAASKLLAKARENLNYHRENKRSKLREPRIGQARSHARNRP